MFRIFTRPQASQITMKLRTSAGMTCTDYVGSFMRLQRTDCSLGAIDADKVITCIIRNDEKLEKAENARASVFAQYAILFTNGEGERRIRVFNFSWTVASNFY
jgi:hypothetical protein